MSDRLHEIIAQIGVLHRELIDNGNINDANLVLSYIEKYDTDIKEHYLNLLLQYYFQKNDLDNLKQLLLKGAKFDMRFDDVKEAFTHISPDTNNVIEFMQDSIILLKDNSFENELETIYSYYINNTTLHSYLKEALEIIKKNRYVCAYCYKNKKEYSDFFINKDLLDSLKRDLPHLLK